MKKLLVISLIAFSTTAIAQPQYAQFATVVGAQEILSVRNIPQQQCHTVNVPIYQQHAPAGGAIGGVVDSVFGSTEGLVGAIVGGAIGSRVGKGSGKRWATGAGAVIGAQVGDRHRQRQQPNVVGYQQQQQCQTAYVAEQYVSGYNVTYDYKGHMFTEYSQFKPVIGSKQMINIGVR